MSKKKHPPYRTSLRIYKKDTQEALGQYAEELGIKKNALVNKIINEYLQRYYSHKSPSTDDLKKAFFSFYSNFKIKTKNLRKTNNRYKNKTLQDFIYRKYYKTSQRKKLYLEILLNQYLSELYFLDLFFNKLDINYYRYYKSRNSQFQVQTLAYQDVIHKFLTEWYYDLKRWNVINSLQDFEIFNFNYLSLENYIYKICKNNFDDFFDEVLENSFFKNELKSVNQIQGVMRARFGDINIKGEIFKQFDVFMKNNSELGDLINTFEFRPHIVFKILDLDDFLKFLVENSLAEQFYDNFTEIFFMQKLTFNINDLSIKKLIKSYEVPMKIMKIYELITERLQIDTNDTENLQNDRIGELKTLYKIFKHSQELIAFNLYKRVLLKQFEKMKHFESNLDSFFDSPEVIN